MNCSVKKRYTAPLLESIAIDQEITLVMASDLPCPPIDCAPPAAKTSLKKSGKTSSPFGGSKPDYSNVE